MSDISVQFDHVGKLFRLGLVGTGTLSHDLNRWWQTKVLHHEDPYLRVGEVNDRAHKGNSDYVWALKDITFDVNEGDVVGIIGKNGAGKSTLLKLLSRVTSPTTGTIRARGRIASLLEVGTGFHGELTGRENIYMNGSILGMTVRLGFAVAAFLDPEILVVDEVLAVGDAEFQKKAIGKMQDVSKGEGRTVLFVSHNMAAIRQLCTRGILLRNGGLVFDGGTEETINEYLSVNRNPNFSNHIVRKNNINSKISIKELFIYKNDILSDGFYNAGDKLLVKIKMQYKTEPNDFDYGVLIHIFKNDGTRIATSSSMLMYGKTYRIEPEVSFI